MSSDFRTNGSKVTSQEQYLPFSTSKSPFFKESLSLKAQESVQSKPTINMGNGLQQQLIFSRYLQLVSILFILLILQVIFCFICFQLDYAKSQHVQFAQELNFIIHTIATLTRFLIEKVKIQYLKAGNPNIQFCTYMAAKLISIYLLYPQPWITYTVLMHYHIDDTRTNYPFKINHFLAIIGVFLSIYKLINIIVVNTRYYCPRAQRICTIYEVQHSYIYGFKCVLKDQPVKMFSIIFAATWVFLTFAFRVSQSQIPIPVNPFKYWQNCSWFVGITITTTGLGDISAYSDLGYLLTLLGSLWGSFNISIITVLMINTLLLSTKEKKALVCFNKVQNTLERKLLAGEYIRISLWRLWINKKNKECVSASLIERRIKRQLSKMRIKQKIVQPMDNLATQMGRQFERIFTTIEILQENNKKMVQHFSQRMFEENKQDQTVFPSHLKSKIDDNKQNAQNVIKGSDIQYTEDPIKEHQNEVESLKYLKTSKKICSKPHLDDLNTGSWRQYNKLLNELSQKIDLRLEGEKGLDKSHKKTVIATNISHSPKR